MCMGLASDWNRHLHAATKPAIARLQDHDAFLGFIANVDALKFLHAKKIETLIRSIPQTEIEKRQPRVAALSIDGQEDFAAALYYGFSKGKALELPCYDKEMFEWFSDYFGAPDEQRIGGQAGIIANQLAALNAHPVCYCPILSPRQAALFDPRVRFPVLREGKMALVSARQAADKDDPTKTNWIFEFRKGDAVEAHGRKIVCPRSNRLIVLSKLVDVEPLLEHHFEPFLPQLALTTDRAMIAGFHHLHKALRKSVDAYLHRLCRQINALKKANPAFRVHIEYVMMHDPRLAKNLYAKIGAAADSLGINEIETQHVLKLFGMSRELADLKKEENAFHLYRAAKALARRFDLERVHVHSLGFYVLYRSKKTRFDPRKETDSLLLAAKTSETRILLDKPPTEKDLLNPKFGKIVASEIGLAQMENFAHAAGLRGKQRATFFKEGWVDYGDHYAFVAPAPVNGRPRRTVGLGDTISSTAFLSEP